MGLWFGVIAGGKRTDIKRDKKGFTTTTASNATPGNIQIFLEKKHANHEMNTRNVLPTFQDKRGHVDWNV